MARKYQPFWLYTNSSCSNNPLNFTRRSFLRKHYHQTWFGQNAVWCIKLQPGFVWELQSRFYSKVSTHQIYFNRANFLPGPVPSAFERFAGFFFVKSKLKVTPFFDYFLIVTYYSFDFEFIIWRFLFSAKNGQYIHDLICNRCRHLISILSFSRRVFKFVLWSKEFLFSKSLFCLRFRIFGFINCKVDVFWQGHKIKKNVSYVFTLQRFFCNFMAFSENINFEFGWILVWIYLWIQKETI